MRQMVGSMRFLPVLVIVGAAVCSPVAGAERDKPKPAAIVAAPASGKAGPEEREQARRLEPLARAAFWAREQSLDPLDTEASLGLSTALRHLGRYGDALEAAQTVLVIQPESRSARYEIARARISSGQGFYAIEHLKALIASDSRDWMANSLLGVALEQSERPAEARQAHASALRIAPDQAAVLVNFALFQAGQGQLVEAETLLRRACAQASATAASRQNLALIVGLQGRVDEAEHLVRQDLPPEVAANNLSWLRAAIAARTSNPGG